MSRWNRASTSNPPLLPFDQCIAKTDDKRPGLSVREHSRIVAAVATAMIQRLPTCWRGAARANPAALAALHDVGKVSPGFQKYIHNERLREIAPALANWSADGFESDHAWIGAGAVRRVLEDEVAAKILAAHHGRWPALPPRHDRDGKFGGESWAQERERLIRTLTDEFGAPANLPDDLAWQYALAGLVCAADWIGSDEDFFPPAGLPPDANHAARAAQAVEACGWLPLELVSDLSFRDAFEFEPNPIQQAFLDAVQGPGLYVLEAPMGAGKTEAALYAAYRLMLSGANRGFYFALPTRVTSDKIHERVEPFLGKVCRNFRSARLAHGRAWLQAFERGGGALAPGEEWFRPRKRALLHPFGVGTVDQALLGVLRVKHHFMRLFGLAGKVVILDEVHSYDVYTGVLLDTLIEHLLTLGCTVIVLSATLTRARRAVLTGEPPATENADAPYPLITARAGGRVAATPARAPSRQDYAVRMEDWDDAAVAAQAVAWAREGRCVLCIANTVAKSQRWFDAVAAAMREGEFDLGLLHAKFVPIHRDAREEEWIGKLGKDAKNRPAGCVLVATQVLEQSVDIDADALITQLAPTDMLLQRMGRVWRHQRKERPCDAAEVVVVAGPADAADTREELLAALGGKSCCVYAPYVLWRTWRVWAARSRVVTPDDVRPLLEQTYAEPDAPEPELILELRRLLEERSEKLRGLALAAQANVGGLNRMKDDESAATRYSDLPTADVLLVRQVDSTGREATVQLLHDESKPLTLRADQPNAWASAKLFQCLLSVPQYVIKRIGLPEPRWWLRKHMPPNTPVWEWDEVSGRLTQDGQPTGYVYDSVRGLRRLADGAAAAPLPYDEYEEFDPFDKFHGDW